MSRQEPLIFIIAGEASGDNLAGRLMGALKEETGGRARFAGVGGPQSAAQGLESLFPMQELSLLGLAEVLPHLPRLIKRLRQTTAAIRELEAVVAAAGPLLERTAAIKRATEGIRDKVQRVGALLPKVA